MIFIPFKCRIPGADVYRSSTAGERVYLTLVLRRALGLILIPISIIGCLLDIDRSLLEDAATGHIDGSDGGTDGCPAEMIAIPEGPTCVDATEVSRSGYADFLRARGADTSGQVATCRFNTDFSPEADWPPAIGTESRPVGAIDWCDALAYCTFRGKRLCGRIGGGASQLASAVDPGSSEWSAACTRGGQQSYPYGDTFAAGRCRGGAAEPVAVGSAPGCEGGYPGLRDLSGNVAEWQDACEETHGASFQNDLCAVLGGGFDADSSGLRCASSVPARRSSSAANRGFRCCTRQRWPAMAPRACRPAVVGPRPSRAYESLGRGSASVATSS